MTIQQLEYVVALDTHRHFVTASEACFVTQPTLTIQIKKLEEEINTLIFDRSKQPLTPTAMGEKIITKARQVLREYYQLQELVKDEQTSMTGHFKMAVLPTIAPYLLPLFLKAFADRYPKTNFEIHEMQSEQIILALKQGTLDMGILVTPLEESEIREVSLFQEPFLIYTSNEHRFYDQKKITAADITTEDLWLLNEGHCFRHQVLNICNNSSHTNSSMGFTYESGSIETLKNMVKANLGYTLVPELAVLHEMDNPRVKRFAAPEPTREISLAVHKSFAKETLLEKMREEILEVIPEHFLKSKKFIKVNWR